MLLQENLGEDPTVRLHTNPDMLAGPSEATVRACLAAFARFHARYHGLSPVEREARLPLRTHPFLSPQKSGLARLINRAAIALCRRKAGEDFPAAVAEVYQRALQHWDPLLDWWYREPLTLIHGDSHLGNFFVSGDGMGMLDFQAAQWGKGLRDVQYFLINSVPAATLAVHEGDWVRYYLQQLAANGVALDFDSAWEQYRAWSLQTLMTIVVSLGLGALTEQEPLMLELLRRSVAAIERLDFAGWFEQAIGRR